MVQVFPYAIIIAAGEAAAQQTIDQLSNRKRVDASVRLSSAPCPVPVSFTRAFNPGHISMQSFISAYIAGLCRKAPGGSNTPHEIDRILVRSSSSTTTIYRYASGATFVGCLDALVEVVTCANCCRSLAGGTPLLFPMRHGSTSIEDPDEDPAYGRF
jgi:hypothetical protein